MRHNERIRTRKDMSSNNSNSNNSSSNSDSNVPPPPSYFGGAMPANISFGPIDDEIGEETTRRAAVAPAAPSISFDNTFSSAVGPSSNISFDNTFSTSAPKPTTLSRASNTKQSPTKKHYHQKLRIKKVSSTKVEGSYSTQWNLYDVPILPEFHPLELSAVFVPHVTNIDEIVSRITSVLIKRNIKASYDNTKAKAKCLTKDNVDFRIRLYRGRGDEYNHGIIVEIQRRYGTSFTFRYDVSSILDAAQGKSTSTIEQEEQDQQQLQVSSTIVSDNDDDFDDIDDDESSSSSSSSCLSIVYKMLSKSQHQNNKQDTKILGLQMLTTLTDPSKIGISTSYQMSKQLSKPNNKLTMLLREMAADNNNTEEESNNEICQMSNNILNNVKQQQQQQQA